MFCIDTQKSQVNFSQPEPSDEFDEEQLLEQCVLSKKTTTKTITRDKSFLSQPAWTDPDDNSNVPIESFNKKFHGVFLPNVGTVSSLKYNSQIVKKFKKCSQGNYDWTTKKLKPLNTNQFGTNIKGYVEKKSNLNYLSFKWLVDLRHLTLNEITEMPKHKNNYKHNCISSLKFHSNYKVLFSTDTHGYFRLFKIENFDNIEEIQRLHLEDFVVSGCDFLTSNGDQILFVGSNVRHMFNFDLMTGKFTKIYLKKNYTSVNPKYCEMSLDGQYLALYADKSGKITLLTQKSKELINTFHTVSSCVRSVKFSPDSRFLIALSDNGQIFVWDLICFRHNYNAIPPLQQFTDKGNTEPTTLDLTRDGRYLITGSGSGVVNLYDIKRSSDSFLQPSFIKCWKNLTVPCTTLISNPTSELLLFASPYKRDTVKMVNLQNFSLFPNFPGRQKRSGKDETLEASNPMGLTYMNSITCANFSPNSGFMALGSDKGNINLYKLNSYPDY